MKGFLGRTIVNGQLKYASVSGVKTFDTRTRGGCPRRWHKRYVGGEREPETDNMRVAKEAGNELDAQVKNYWRTGSKAISALAVKGLHMLEAPGPDLKLDKAIHSLSYIRNGQSFAPLPDGQYYPKDVEVVVRSALTAGGVPFVGELDMAHERGHYRDDEGEYHQDPPKTIEVCDLKYKANAKDRDGNSHFLLPTDLVRDIQMAGYGEWVGRVRPDIERVRLSLLYFPKKGAQPTKVTRLHVLDDCRRTWEYVDSVVRSMVDVARETDIEKVPGADRAMSCDAYGGCPYRDTCSAYKRTSLDNLYNKIAEDHLNERTTPVGLIAQTQPQLMQQATSQQQLAAEEQAMRAQVAQQQQQMPQQQFNAAEFLTVCHRLGSYGFGMPSLAGNAAQAYAAAGGQSVAPGFVYQGLIAPPGAQYSLHGMTLTEVTQVYQIEREAAAKVNPQPAPSFPPVQMPAGTPPVTQAIANAYNQTVANQALPAQPMQMQQVSFLPPGAPESMPQLAMQQSAPPQQTADPTEEPKKAGRPKKQKSQDAAPEPTAAVMQGPPPSSPAPAPQVAPAAESAIPQEKVGGGFVLINARFSDVDTKSLASYVDYVNAELSKRYCVTADGKPCPQDVRCAPKDSPLAFGGWKGAVREVVKADPPPAGLYHLDTFLDELNEAVADALRIVANQRGWFYVRGVR